MDQADKDVVTNTVEEIDCHHIFIKFSTANFDQAKLTSMKK